MISQNIKWMGSEGIVWGTAVRRRSGLIKLPPPSLRPTPLCLPPLPQRFVTFAVECEGRRTSSSSHNPRDSRMKGGLVLQLHEKPCKDTHLSISAVFKRTPEVNVYLGHRSGKDSFLHFPCEIISGNEAANQSSALHPGTSTSELQCYVHFHVLICHPGCQRGSFQGLSKTKSPSM